MDNCNTANSMSDLWILLRDMIYVRKLTDEEIVEKLPQFKSQTIKRFVMEQIAAVRDYPQCPDCNVRLWHKSVEYGCPEALYCPDCGRAFEVESPNPPLPEIGGEI